MPNRRLPFRLLSALLLLISVTVLVQTLPARAQLVTVTEDYYVTEVRADKKKIGVAAGKTRETRNWVKVDGNTRVARRVWVTRHSYRDEVISLPAMWKLLKPGKRIKVSGGRDWDQTVVARKIWL